MKSQSTRCLLLLQAAAWAICLAASCAGAGQGVPNPQNSAYYWKTVYSRDSMEQGFVSDFNIRKLYIRYFDVIPDAGGHPRPNATIRFKDAPDSSLEVVPTVFIAESCMRASPDTMAALLVDRVLQISEVNGVARVGEIQIDCDWTQSSQKTYFSFLEKVRRLCAGRGLALSATIRLHQLAMDPPPCDYGALMLYNTGNVRDPRVENPILAFEQVAPFIGRISKYRLPLCAALPNFKWQLLSGKGKFKAILYSLDMADTSMFVKVSDSEYLAVRSKDVPRYMGDGSFNVMINLGDTVKVRKAEFSEIEKVCARIMETRPDVMRQVIIYDLNNSNINNISKSDYEKIFDFGAGVSRR